MLNLPDPIFNPDLADIKDLCETWMEEQVLEVEDTDTVQYIAEEVLKALYGKGIFNVLKELRERNKPVYG